MAILPFIYIFRYMLFVSFNSCAWIRFQSPYSYTSTLLISHVFVFVVRGLFILNITTYMTMFNLL